MGDQESYSSSCPTTDKMGKWYRRVALVTGASRGIGAAITESLVKAGMTVVGVSPNNVDKLEAKIVEYRGLGYPGTLVPMSCDISDLLHVQTMFASIRADPDVEGVDVCINNAGIALSESFITGDPTAWKKMFEVNVLGTGYVTQEAIKSMFDRGVDDGHVIFINSLAGHRMCPGNKDLHVYSCTKFAERAMQEALRYELRGMETGIKCSSVSPGVVETDLYTQLFEGDEEKAKAFLSERKYLEAKNVADAVVYTLTQPPHVQIHDILMRSTDQIP